MTKGITMATAKAVAAGNSCRQEDVIATANLSRRAIADMLRACKVGRARDLGPAKLFGGLWVPSAMALGANWGFPVSVFQEAAYHPEGGGDVRQRALRFGKECADGYLELLEHVLVVSVPGPVPRVGRGLPVGAPQIPKVLWAPHLPLRSLHSPLHCLCRHSTWAIPCRGSR